MEEKSVTLEILRAQYGVMAKICHHVRHGLKTPDNHITPECFAGIEANGLPRLSPAITVLHWGSALARTYETAEAARLWIENNGGTIREVLAGDPILGSTEIFEMFSGDVMTAIKGGMKNYEAVKTYATDALAKWAPRLEQTCCDIFDELEPGDNCLVVSHSPTVEFIFNLFAQPDEVDDKMMLKELEGIFLVQTEDGKIIVHR